VLTRPATAVPIQLGGRSAIRNVSRKLKNQT
jgi:hypothetical protein